MPKRSFRSRIIKEEGNCSTGESNVNLALHEEKVESFLTPNEMKKQIADALKETSKTKPSKIKNKRTRNKVSEFNTLFGGKKSGKLSGPEVNQMLHYADVVRNKKNNKENICDERKLREIREETEADALKETPRESDVNYAIKEALRGKSEERRDSIRSQDEEPSKANSVVLQPKDGPSQVRPQDLEVSESKKSSICSLLGGIDPEVLNELELDDTNWEVISIDGWSHCGSDTTDDQFYLISREDTLAMHSFDEDSEFDSDICESSQDTENEESTAQETCSKDKKDANIKPEKNESDDSADSKKKAGKKSKKGGDEGAESSITASVVEAKPPSSVNTTPLKKKKVVVTRKYVGKEDFGEKLTSLGFKTVPDSAKGDANQWTGMFSNNQVNVSSRTLCGVLLITLRAESDSLLTGLTTLQGLTASTGNSSKLNISFFLELKGKKKRKISIPKSNSSLGVTLDP